MDLRSNNIDMNRSTWFGEYNNYNNLLLTSNDNEFLWEFFYKVINNVNGIINTTPEDKELLTFRYKSYTCKAITYFYLFRTHQHTMDDNSKEAITIDFGVFVIQKKSTVGGVKNLILKDLTSTYKGLEGYSRKPKEEIDTNVVASYLARYYLTYKNWAEAEKYTDITMRVG